MSWLPVIATLSLAPLGVCVAVTASSAIVLTLVAVLTVRRSVVEVA